jgi:hypothetical protein
MSGRPASYLAAIGLIVALLGLGLDAWLHSTEAASPTEEVFSFANPGHVLFGAGLLLTVAGVAWSLLPGRPGSTGHRGHLLAGFLVMITAGVLAYGFSVEDHAHDHAEGAIADPTEGLSAEDLLIVEGSRHDHAAKDHNTEFRLSGAEVLKLADETARARQVAERYQSIESALTDGYYQVTQDLPLIGAHFLKPEYADGVFDAERPEILIYAYQQGSWRLYGYAYLSRPIGFEGEEPPEGFTGPFDTWHWHEQWCFTRQGLKRVSEDACLDQEGVFVPRTGYMAHFWIIDNPAGLFAHSHPSLRGSTQYITPPRLHY